MTETTIVTDWPPPIRVFDVAKGISMTEVTDFPNCYSKF